MNRTHFHGRLSNSSILCLAALQFLFLLLSANILGAAEHGKSTNGLPETNKPEISGKLTEDGATSDSNTNKSEPAGIPQAIIWLAGANWIAAIFVFSFFIFLVSSGKRTISLESHWGGYGGALGGWIVSPALACIFTAFLLFGSASVLTYKAIDALHKPSNTDPATLKISGNSSTNKQASSSSTKPAGTTTGTKKK